MKYRDRFGLQTLIQILCFGILAGCSFRGGELPRYHHEQLRSDDHKPSIGYSVLLIGPPKKHGDHRSMVRLEDFREETRKAFSDSALFSDFNEGAESRGYYLTLALYYPGEKSRTLLGNYYTYLSAVTFGVIPWYDTQDYFLIVDVRKGNQFLKQYRYKHSRHTVYQLLLVFFLFDSMDNSKGVEREVIRDMVLNFLHDLKEDNILNAFSLEGG